jgi:hypothetical protein
LVADGVRYYGPENFRLPGRTIPARFGLRPQKTTRSPAEQLALLRKDGHRVLLSEENYIGSLNPQQGYAKSVRYGDASAKISALAAAIGQDIDVFMSVRRPTAFINSAYCQLLMGGQVMPMAKYQKRHPLSSVNWLDLVRRVRTAPGVGRVVVWRYEDYAPLFEQIAAELVGAGPAHHVKPVTRHIHRGLSAAAVAEVLSRDETETNDQIGMTARKKMPISEDYPAFDGFDPDAHVMGDAAYSAQLKGIAALDGVTLLQVGPQ